MPGLFAIDAQLQAVLTADRDLAGPQHAFGAALEPQHDVDVVVELAARDERVEIGRDRLGLEPGHKARKVIGVRADIADAPACARIWSDRCARRPACCHRRSASASQSCGYSTCTTRILPSTPDLDQLARLPDQRIARVVVGEKEFGAVFRL